MVTLMVISESVRAGDSASEMNMILTSDFPSTENQVVIDQIRRFGGNPRIAWLPPNDIKGRECFAAAREQFKAIGLTNIKYCEYCQTFDEKQTNILGEFDIIYLSGGNPIDFRNSISEFDLRTHLQRCLDRGSLLIGASGGAMQLTRNISLFRLMTESVDQVLAKRKDFISLNFVDYEFLPHLNRFESSFMNKVREYSEGVDCDIIAVSDGGAIVHSGDGLFGCYGKAVRYSHGVRTDIGTET